MLAIGYSECPFHCIANEYVLIKVLAAHADLSLYIIMPFIMPYIMPYIVLYIEAHNPVSEYFLVHHIFLVCM